MLATKYIYVCRYIPVILILSIVYLGNKSHGIGFKH